jgi:tRNA(Ile)-lysidine synthase
VARRALSPACLTLVQAVEAHVPPALGATGLGRVAVALSGGTDSLALAAAVAWAVRRADGPMAGVAAAAHIVDHALQAGSAEVAARAAAQAEALGLAAAVSRVSVTATGAGLEADARAARYAALLADPERLVATAHTLDDQAETVLLGLARGSGPRSLAGMPARSGRLVRPLLGLPRTATAQACADWGLEPWSDPMNDDPAFARVRARRALAALDGALGPGLAEGLARTARLAAADADYLDELAQQAGPAVQIGAGLGVTRLAALPAALRGRVLLAWLRAAGGDIGWVHVAAVDALVVDWHGQAGVDVPGGRVARRDGRLVFEARPA